VTGTREIEDIAGSLVKHQHDHPPVRDLNRESDRRLGLAQRVADGLGRLVGSWTSVLIQVVLVGAWLTLNVVSHVNHGIPIRSGCSTWRSRARPRSGPRWC
jgi:uncharacterized membrane protein